MKKTILIMMGLMFVVNTANAMCVYQGKHFITKDKTTLEKLNIKHEKYKDAYIVSFDKMGEASVDEFCKKVSCKKAIVKMRGCGDTVFYIAP